MTNFGIDVLVNIIANLFAWLIVFVFAGVGFLWHVRTSRAALFRFFGLDPSKPSITVYLTTVFVQPGGAKRFDESIAVEWEGPAISLNSLYYLSIIPMLFRLPVESFPRVFRDLLSTKQLSFNPIEVSYKASPKSISEIADGPILCLTNSRNNLATKYFVETSGSFVDFTEDYQLLIKRGSFTGKKIFASDDEISIANGEIQRSSHDLGLVTKLTDMDNQRNVIIAAGTGSNGNRAAIEFLVERWQKLDKQFGDSEFAIILECPNRRVDTQGYKLAKVLMTLPSVD